MGDDIAFYNAVMRNLPTLIFNVVLKKAFTPSITARLIQTSLPGTALSVGTGDITLWQSTGHRHVDTGYDLCNMVRKTNVHDSFEYGVSDTHVWALSGIGGAVSLMIFFQLDYEILKGEYTGLFITSSLFSFFVAVSLYIRNKKTCVVLEQSGVRLPATFLPVSNKYVPYKDIKKIIIKTAGHGGVYGYKIKYQHGSRYIFDDFLKDIAGWELIDLIADRAKCPVEDRLL